MRRTQLGIRPTRGRLAVAATALLGAYAGVAVAALTGSPRAFLVFLIAGHLLDVAVQATPALTSVLRGAQLGISNRALLREIALIVLVARVPWDSSRSFYAVALGALALPLIRSAYLAVLLLLQRRLLQPVEVRNVDLSGLRLPRRPPELLLTRPGTRLHHLGLAPLLAGSLAAATGDPLAFYVVAGAVLVAVIAAMLVLLMRLVADRGAVRGPALLAAMAERVAALEAEVVVYFSGSASSIYQINMWLATIDRLSARCLIVLRERRNLSLLAATDTPVICIPGQVDFMTFPLPHARVALYTSNVGKNLHMLRIPGVKHVFIGHGDSDKTASFNPFSKVYSEIWVAGAAGGDRYLRAQVGVRGEEIVEVGRPQLDAIRPAAPGLVGPLLTVLYAPTWEGWTDDPGATSLRSAGPVLVERLLAARPHVRVIYKPHPLTGTVSAAARAASDRITALLEADNVARRSEPALAGLPAGSGELPARLIADPDATPAEQERRYTAWSAAWWPAEPAWAHRTVTGPAPTLYDCFNAADVLVADISSVVSDFLASQKPYVVPNLLGLPDEAFRDTYPTAAAAYLLDPAAERLPGILELLRGSDPLAARRAEQKAYLLGPDVPPAMTRFDAAVQAALRSARETWPERPLVDAPA